MKLKSIVLAATLVVSGGAFAAHNLGPLTTTPDSFAFVAGPGLFSAGYIFSLTSLSNVSGGASDFLMGSSIGVTISNGLMSFTDINATDGFSFAGLGAGNYTFNVFGFVPGSAKTIAGSIMATPVPEVETYAMMLAGLGALGFLARRRKKG